MVDIEKVRAGFEFRWQKLYPEQPMQRAGDYYYNDAAQIAWGWWKDAHFHAHRLLALQDDAETEKP